MSETVKAFVLMDKDDPGEIREIENTLAPSQYPHRPAGEMEIQEGRCHQMTIDEWLGLEEKNDMKKIKEARR